MRYIHKNLSIALVVFALAACGGRGDKGLAELPPASEQLPSSDIISAVSDTPVRLGTAFSVGSTKYTPEDIAAYDEVGYASWYGSEFNGRNTANGEPYVSAAISAAHKTLPMPTYVEVTALDTGRTIVVRVNDRGPFANDRLLDLSEGAARQLGIIDQGIAAVRVRKVNPPEQEKALLRSGQSAPARLDTPESLRKILREKVSKMPRPAAGNTAVPIPAGKAAEVAAITPAEGAEPQGEGRFVREGAGNSRPATPPVNPAQKADGRFVREGAAAPTAAAAHYVVQVAAYSSRERAEALAKKIGARILISNDGIFRVRFGPFATEAEAQKALADAQQRGYPQAKVFRE